MEMIETETLDRLIAELDVQIGAAERLNLQEMKLLLAVTRLDLQLKRHNVGDDELRALCEELENAVARHRSHEPDVLAPIFPAADRGRAKLAPVVARSAPLGRLAARGPDSRRSGRHARAGRMAPRRRT